MQELYHSTTGDSWDRWVGCVFGWAGDGSGGCEKVEEGGGTVGKLQLNMRANVQGYVVTKHG